MVQVPVKQQASRSVDRRVRPRRDFAAMQERRMRAADLFEQGVIPAEVARQVGVSHQIVSDWRAAWRRSGRDGLRGAGRAGRLPKLSRDQLAQVEGELAKGAAANGYAVWYILRQGLNWSWQRPARRATERNDEAIHRWVKQRWPQLKKRHEHHNNT